MAKEHTIHRHDDFYLEDGNVTFQVENVLFRIHKYFLVRESSIFKTMFSLPPSNEAGVEGTTDDQPIKLEFVTSSSFERLLWIFYPATWGDPQAPFDHWLSILELASMWDFPKIRTLAESKLRQTIPNDMSPLERIVLAQRWDLQDLLLPPFVELAVRATPLTLTEGRQLGIDSIILVGQAREKVKEEEMIEDVRHGIYLGAPNPTPREKRQSVWNLVASIFGLPQAVAR